MADLTLKVDGMTCMGCVKSVTNVLNEMAGVSEAEVNLDKAQALVSYDPDVVSPEELAAAVADAGFEVEY